MTDYSGVLAAIHREWRPRTYLEIGVYQGDTLRLAGPDTLCVGIDPDPILPPEDEPSWCIERTTSDEFFAGPRPRDLFGDSPVDLVFIDGMHIFEYVLRDFTNAESLAGGDSLVVLHDVLPADAVTASRERSTQDWTGDVWKMLLCLLDNRPDLDLCLVDVPPSGLLLVRHLDPADQTFRREYSALVDQYAPMGFDAWEARAEEVIRRTTRVESELWLQRGELAVLRDRLAALAILRDCLGVSGARASAEAAAWRQRLEESQAEVSDLLTLVDARDAQASDLKARLAASQTQVVAGRNQLRILKASTSWRLTAPLRSARRLMRRT